MGLSYDSVKQTLDSLGPEELARLQLMLKSGWPDGHVVGPDGKPIPFHLGQRLAWDSQRRIVAIVSGSQSGKTSLLPWWLHREIQTRGGGDYLAVSATYDLFKLKMLPEMLKVFEGILKIGRFYAGVQTIEICDPTGKFLATRSTDPMWARIILRSSDARGGLESTTAMGAVLDEAGQDVFDILAWRAIQRRVAMRQGRILIASTLYNLGWLAMEIIDRADEGGNATVYKVDTGGEVLYTDNPDADIALIQADSIVNPSYPVEEYERAQATMPEDEFNMFHRGRKSILRFIIYDCFDSTIHTCPRFAVPSHWPRYIGVDLGGTHMAAIYIAEDPNTKILYAYREYKAGYRTAAEHAERMLAGEPEILAAVGGSVGEGQYRREFGAAGFQIKRPQIGEVNVGINRVYATLRTGGLVFFDDLKETLEEITHYRRKRTSRGEVLDEIWEKDRFHFMDATRYIISEIRANLREMIAFQGTAGHRIFVPGVQKVSIPRRGVGIPRIAIDRPDHNPWDTHGKLRSPFRIRDW